MVEILCAFIAAVAAIICAAMAAQSSKREKREQAEQERIDRRAEQRAKEGRLQLSMLDANCRLIWPSSEVTAMVKLSKVWRRSRKRSTSMSSFLKELLLIKLHDKEDYT